MLHEVSGNIIVEKIEQTLIEAHHMRILNNEESGLLQLLIKMQYKG